MPSTVTSQAIPVPNGQNTIQVLQAIRNAIISMSNTSAGRAGLTGTPSSQNPQASPSQFVVSKVVYTTVTFPAVIVVGATGANATVTTDVPVLQRLELTNTVSGETWQFIAPGKSTSGGAVGRPSKNYLRTEGYTVH